ncbi:MAG: hypothetical protein WCJ56_05265 [bacterium]
MPPVTADPARLTHEIGDILFATVNLARFARRFTLVEEEVKRKGRSLAQMTVAHYKIIKR